MSPLALWEFYGRLHPMLLHVPIGLLVGLAALETIDFLRRSAETRPAQTWLVRLLAVTTTLSALSGFVLAYEPTYNAASIQWHMWLGIGGAVATVGLAWAECARRRGRPRGSIMYRAAIAICLALIGPAGHLGAAITHGENFLWKPFDARKPRRADSAGDRSDTHNGTAAQMVGTASFERASAVLQSYCVSCHGPEKDKGGLRLDGFEAVMEGAQAGTVVLPGDAEGSVLVQRMRLPIEHDDHMPPAKHVQPGEADIRLIEDWIRAGAKQAGSP